MTDPLREAFEAWFNQKMFSGLLSKLVDGEYSWPDTQLTWDSWQAATKAERERAALVCEKWMTTSDSPDVCAAAIRQGGAL